MHSTLSNSRAERVALVERILMARVMGDFDYLESVSTPDIVVKLIGDVAIFPYCGTVQGKPDARKALEQVYIDFKFENMKIIHIMIDGDHVGFRWEGVLRHRGTGACGDFEGFTHLIFENNLIKEYYTLVDTASLSKLGQMD